MAKVWTRIRETIERHGSAGASERRRRRRLGAARNRRPHRAAAGRRIFRHHRRRPPGIRGDCGGARGACGRTRQADFRDWPLGPNLGQCCGGMVKTLTETFDATDLAAVRRLEEAERAGAFATHSRSMARAASRARSRRRTPAANSRRSACAPSRRWRSASNSAKSPRRCCCSAPAMSAAPWCWRWRRCRSLCTGSTASPDQFPQHVPQNVVTIRTDAVERELGRARRATP